MTDGQSWWTPSSAQLTASTFSTQEAQAAGELRR